ncbi:Protein Rf1, mitochondrial, partial [Dichanthelium oligosanthes]
MYRAAGPRVVSPTCWTYGILMDCCTRACRPDLALAYFGLLLRTGSGFSIVALNNLLKSLCEAKRTDEALDVLLHRMPELGCVPDVVSYNILLKSFCDNGNSQRACELLQMMAEKGAVCSPDVVTYTTVIDGLFKEGKVAKAFDLLNEMMQQGISPNLVTYNCSIDALCKARAMDNAKIVLRQMVHKGIQPNIRTYNSLMYGHGKNKDARDVFDTIAVKGQKPDIVSYLIMLDGYATEGCFVDMMDFFNLMLADGKMDDAMEIFNRMIVEGVAPNRATYYCLIQGFITHGGFLKAKELVFEMMNK